MERLEQLTSAQRAIDSEHYTDAVRILEPLCVAGEPVAQSMLGVLYQLGLGVPVDGVKAVTLLSAAAKQGDGVAAHNLGTIYVTGLPGIERDTELSRFYYRLARDLGAKFSDDSFYE